MAEEHRFQSAEGHILCANNCGFFGSPATSNLCSKCYRDLHMKEEQDAIAKAALENKSLTVSSASSSSSSSPSSSKITPGSFVTLEFKSQNSTDEAQALVVEPVAQPRLSAAGPNRCLTCRKRVGLTGFKCRCGWMFCGSHRYPEEHGCSFDYKKAGKEEIAKANPLVKGDKLQKI